ncbi:MAG: acyl-CoA dehydrogenase family protein [Proteobacteria bacterium]|jgi:acyl-CoA dehydrogenase|nr:acyl-CoA dehydrogenase family protein [Pseudomonadota bacterium]
MPLIYTEEHEIFRRSLRKFFDTEVIPQVEHWRKQGFIPREIWKKMGAQGFIGYWLPPEFGGSGLDFSYSVVLSEEMIRSSSDLGVNIGVHNDVALPYIAHSGTEEQKKKYLPPACTGDCIVAIAMTEPGAGSDLASIRSTAIRKGDHYIVNGQKTFISNGYFCDLAIVAVKTDPKADPPHTGVSLILVEAGTPGFTKGRKLEKMGLHAADTSELSFEDCKIPVGNLLGVEGGGFFTLMQNLQQERLMGAIGAILGAQQILETTIEYTKTREAFGRPICKFQHNAFKIVEMATEIEMARTFTYKLIDEYLDGKDIVKAVSMAKWYNSELVNRVAYQCVQLHGGYGYMLEYPVAQAYLDARMQTIAAGTTEIMKLIIARLMGLL